MIANLEILSAESKLVLACCKNSVKEFLEAYDVDINNFRIDQNEVVRLCNRHQISPVVYNAIQSINTPTFTSILDSLKAKVVKIQIKSIATNAFLQKLGKRISEHGIDMFLLKGTSVSRKYYGDIGMRDAMDVDLLVSESHLDEVIQLLSQMGYSQSGNYFSYTPSQRSFIKYIDYHFGFSSMDGSSPRYIELHWAIRNRFGNFILDPFLEKSSTCKDDLVTQKNIKELDDIDGFLFLCSHGSEHAFYRLKWLVDIYMAHTKVAFDYQLLLDRSLELKCTEQLILSYMMLDHFFSVQIPLEIEQASKKYPISDWLIEYCTEQVLYSGEYCDTFRGKIKNMRFSFIMNRKGLLNKRLLMRYFTSPNDWKLVRLPDHLFFLYFILRPFLFIYRRLKG